MKKLLASLLALSMVLVGCSSSSDDDTEETTTTEETTESTVAEATGTATGMGELSVTIKAEDGKITEVTIVGDNETPSIGQAAFEDLQQQIIDAQSADIDGVSGATITSGAVSEAAQAAIDELGL